jgi:hypothetical protein
MDAKNSLSDNSNDPNGFDIVIAEIPFCDDELKRRIAELSESLEDYKTALGEVCDGGDDHLAVTLARFSYALAKEDYEAFHSEARRRGLIIA